MLFWKNTLTKNMSCKEKDLINKGKCFTENNNCEAWSGRRLLLWLARREHHSTKCGSDPQTIQQDVLENLDLQISGISRQHTYVSFHRSTVFTFSLGFAANSTIHTICCYIIAADQITHIIAVISNWNFWFCWLESVWLQAEFFEVSHSFDFWLSARWTQRFAEGHFVK